MDPTTLVILGLVEAAKLATTLIGQVQAGEITPEEAAARWQAQANQWNNAVVMWRATPSG